MKRVLCFLAILVAFAASAMAVTVELGWLPNPVDDQVLMYEVIWSQDGTAFAHIADVVAVPDPTYSHTFTRVPGQKSVWYSVRAINLIGISLRSDAVEAVLPPVAAPAKANKPTVKEVKP